MFKSCLEKLEPYKLQPFGILSRTLALQSPGILMFMNGELQACSYVFVYDSAVGDILKNYYSTIKLNSFCKIVTFICGKILRTCFRFNKEFKWPEYQQQPH